jgi:FKBP-type peptidyl-prolyl cis-trans isomerase
MKKILSFSFVIQTVICLLSGSLLLFSCAHSEYADYEKTETGLMYKFHTKGKDTIHAKYDQVVRVKLAKRLGDSTLESTASVSPDGIEQLLQKGAFKGAIEEGITLMAIGDSATFLISTDSINKYYPARDSTKNFKPGSYLAFDVKLMNIQTKEEVMWEREQSRKAYVADRKVQEPKELSQYIQDNHIEVKPNAKGIYLIETQKGSGTMPKDGDSVVVHYTGSFLNGTVFDSSVKRGSPFGFVVNAQGEKSVIQGWNEAIKMMKRGTTATIILPSSMAYDSTGYMNPKTGKYFIPPYSPMKFDIQLIDIKTKK